jgi:hypothetical protein
MLVFLVLVPTRKRPKTAKQIPVSREPVNVAHGLERSSIYLSTGTKKAPVAERERTFKRR